METNNLNLKNPYSSKKLEKPKPIKKEHWYDRFMFWIKPKNEGFEFKFTIKF